MYSVRSLSKIERKQEMIKKYSEEKRLEVINARKAEATIAQIAVMTGVGQTTVKAWLKNAGCQN
jgi:transposase-like protein